MEEKFQHVIASVISGIQGCKNISGDIIVFGKSTKEHDQALHKLLQRLGLTLNKKKCQFYMPSVELYFNKCDVLL